jgi:DNA polymerase-3 subunit gamma/tau
VLIRIAYAADLPSPADLAHDLTTQTQPQTPASASPPASPTPGGNGGGAPATAGSPATAIADPVPVEAPSASAPATAPRSFLDVLKLFEKYREIGIRTQLYNSVHLVKFEPGRIEFRPTDLAPRDLASKTMKFLEQWTGTRWVVTISQEQGDPTLADQDAAAERKLMDAAEQLPVVQAVKEAFPGAVIRKVTSRKEFTDPDAEPEFLEAPEDPEDDEDERI